MKPLNDRDYEVIGGIVNALYDSAIPLSTIEIWYAVQGYCRPSYGEVRRLLRSGAIDGIAVKTQLGGYGRRDYYLTQEHRDELKADGF